MSLSNETQTALLDPVCRLYIEGPSSLINLEKCIAKSINGIIGVHITRSNTTVIDPEVTKGTEPPRKDQVDGFLHCDFGAFIGPESNVKPEAYLQGMSRLTNDLRANGFKVVASCDFEDEIARRTGWNWSENSTLHP